MNHSWSDYTFLKLNLSKSDLIYFSKFFRLIESLPLINISSNLSLTLSSTIHRSGSTFDSPLSLMRKIKFVAKSSFFHLCRIKQLKFFLDNPTLKLLVFFHILSRFANCNSSYYGLLKTKLHPLTKAFNSVACLVFGTYKFSCLTPTLISLHWLPFKKRSVFKICTLMFKIKDNHSPNHLVDLFKLPFRKKLRSTYSYFLGYLLIILKLNLYFSTVDLFNVTLSPPLLLFLFHFIKPLKLCSNSS